MNHRTLSHWRRIAAALCAAALSACGGGSGSPEQAAQGASQQVTARALAESGASTTTWKQCAVEYGTCTFTGTRQVRYGAGGQHVVRTATGSVACSNDVFGDPFPGADKICEVAQDTPAPAPTTSWTQCAVEYGSCTFSGTRQVRYGLGGKYAVKTATGTIACNNDVFGDPNPGANKVCEVASTTTATTPPPATAPVTWTQCAVEYGTCTFTGTRQVRYGAGGQHVVRTATGSVACNNDVFGDPAPGADKVCEAASAQATTPSAGAPGPYLQDASLYTPTFTEEFDGAQLNAGKWKAQLWYQGSDPTPNYQVSGGSLKMWPVPGTRFHRDYRHITTDGLFYQTYGFFEMEAKLPRGQGVWPAFWLLNHDQPDPYRPEIDIMEAYPGGGPNSGWGDANLRPVMYEATAHFGEGAKVGSKKLSTPDLSAGFHKYAVKWEPGKQTFYFDGVPFYTLNVDMTERMFLLLSFQFGSASGDGGAGTPTGIGNAYEINYVRAWKLGGAASGAQKRVVEYHGDSTVWGYRSGTGGQVAQPAPAVFYGALKSPAVAYEVRNEGVSGATACDLLYGTDGKHLPWNQHIAASPANYVVINHAINDQWKVDIPTYQSCLRQLARLAKAQGKQVVFETPNPTRDSGAAGLDRYVAAMRQTAALEQVPVIDQYAHLTTHLNGRAVTVICPDGLHPTQEVYTLKGKYAAQRFSAIFP